MASLGLVYCTLVWGSTFFIVKKVLREVDPTVLVAYRFLVAAILLLPWIVRRRRRVFKPIKQGAILAGLLSIVFISQTVGLTYTSASNSGFITGLFILFVPVFLFLFFRRPPTRLQCLAIGLALVGLWVLTGGIQKFNKGDALTLLTAAAVALHLLATDVYVKGEVDTVVLAFHQFWMTGIGCLIIAAVNGAALTIDSMHARGEIVFLGAIPTLSAFCIQMWAQTRVAPVRVALIFLLEPVVCAIFSWTLGGELFKITGALGGGLIVVAMVVSELSKLTLRKARKNEVLPI